MPRWLVTCQPRQSSHSQGALNSAVECHLHTVEVAGSNPAAPTINSLKINHFETRLILARRSGVLQGPDFPSRFQAIRTRWHDEFYCRASGQSVRLLDAPIAPGASYGLNSNQFTLATLPVPLKTTYKSCTSEAPETVAVTVCHVSQLPVTGSVAVAANGPVRLSR